MTQSAAMILRILLIYIIVKLVNCSANAEMTDHSQMTLNRYESMEPTNESNNVNSRRISQQPLAIVKSYNNDNDHNDHLRIDNGNDSNYAKIAANNDSKSSQRIKHTKSTTNYATNSIINSFKSSSSNTSNNLYLELVNDLPEFESIRQKRQTNRQDMCDEAECTCKSEMKFLTVDCHFQHVSSFDEISFFHLLLVRNEFVSFLFDAFFAT